MLLLDLTEPELATRAQASRAMAHKERERARNIDNPATRASIQAAAQRYAALLEKLEAARRLSRSESN